MINGPVGLAVFYEREVKDRVVGWPYKDLDHFGNGRHDSKYLRSTERHW